MHVVRRAENNEKKKEREREGGREREREREREKESFLHNSSPHTITSRVANPFARLVFHAVTLHGFSRGVDARAAMFPPRKNKAHCSVLLASSERKREREREGYVIARSASAEEFSQTFYLAQR